MTERWRILAVLFLTRATMGFQFQAVAAMAPQITERYGIGLTELGFLIGLYLSPGILLAVPGGAIGQRFGETRTVAAGLGLMILGGVLMAAVPIWEAQIAGRLLAGAGGVLLNVLMAKMVSDWFAGRELAMAMGIYVNSWPVGIAVALIALPSLTLATGQWLVPALVLVGLLLLLVGYKAPPGEKPEASAGSARLARSALLGVVITGSVWGLFNGGLVIVLAFGPTLLTDLGWDELQAGTITSLVLWLIALFTPLGGLVADRIGRAEPVIYIGLSAFIATILAAASLPFPVFWFAAMGVAAGLVPGAIMSLPIRHLSPQNRALGMGVYFGMYYVAIFLSPILGGALAEAYGTAAMAFVAAAALNVSALGCAAWNARRVARAA